MRCMACGGGMILVNVAQDDTMGISGFEHHTFTCSECQDIERRLVFTKHGREAGLSPRPFRRHNLSCLLLQFRMSTSLLR